MTDVTLADFLLARIAEDEAAARAAAGVNEGFEGGDHDWCPDWLGVGIRHLVRNCDIECPIRAHEDGTEDCGRPHRYAGRHIARHDPDRVLADCEAKRLIVEEYREENSVDVGAASVDADGGAWRALEYVLCLLALPYADHPDYDRKWRP